MTNKLGVTLAAAALCLFCWALPPTVGAQEIRPDSSGLVVLSQNQTDRIFQLYIQKDSAFYPVKGGTSSPHTNQIWLIPSAQLGRDSLCVLMWILVGTHQMKADTILRYDGRVNIYRRDFASGKPEARSS
jgi:hypothetical protein